jgi:hypothetical protein
MAAQNSRRSFLISAGLLAFAFSSVGLRGQQRTGDTTAQDESQGFRFKSGVELINVTATVTDARGRFVPGLKKEDFLLYEDGRQQPITHFSAERVPVSLGIVLDTSGSMVGEKWASAMSALDRFLFDLLDPCAQPHPPVRRNGAPGCRRGGRAPRPNRTEPEKGRRHHL